MYLDHNINQIHHLFNEPKKRNLLLYLGPEEVVI